MPAESRNSQAVAKKREELRLQSGPQGRKSGRLNRTTGEGLAAAGFPGSQSHLEHSKVYGISGKGSYGGVGSQFTYDLSERQD
ncbi:hypothetical protein chiPu_0008625 [Chiloscyllium punctatum]|uniref:Uncharacterized protein n=1 Tax=Chiloscyllium punctatum TaxID=137246 RepID=A0A401SIF0_CHIPU|nr:hypothetical protein [Chiloscyllium punctatum]